jgi:vancomycin resistance protein YoaR
VTADSTTGDRKGVWLALAGMVLLLAGLYAAGVFFLGTRIPPGTDVAGVDIGGLGRDDARTRLDAAMTERAQRPIRLTSGEQHIDVTPADAGLAVDVDATVAEAGGGRTWNPVQMVDVLLGSENIEPVLDVDQQALDAQLAEVAGRFDEEVVEAEVTFTRTGSRQVTRPESGLAVDTEAAAETLTTAFVENQSSAELPVLELQPTVSSGALEAALRDLAEPAVSGPITLQLADQTAQLRVPAFAPALSLQVDGGELVPVFDIDRLDRGLERLREEIGSDPQDATVELRGGVPVVVPDQPGLALHAEEVAKSIVRVLSRTGDARRAEVGTGVEEAEFTTEDAKALEIEEEVSSFVTYFPYAEYRNVNQARAAELISGTVLKPGETFSFNDTVGERTAENGFVPGFIISDGVFREELGGGVSQVVTTTYNAAFFAGLEDVEHKPHSFYIDRYPLGREATVAWPTVDLKFKNNTPYGVLIEAWVVDSTPATQGEMHVRMWSTKYWEIEAGVSERYNFTSPGTRYDSTDQCVATTGYGGFDVNVMRYVRRVGSSELVRTEVDKVTYTPADTVICS